MKYLRLTHIERDALWRELEDMPRFLAERFVALTPEESTTRGPDGTFSPVEQSWHLADLEREGFGVRIQRLLRENHPLLPDFDGARLANERGYNKKSLGKGIEAFREARLANIAALRSLEVEDWSRAGTQEGVGEVSLCDLPLMMAEHDAAHKAEIGA
ncbi:MAG TPA: DinB family protein [Vicinamibacteria bacterium]|nr:DinB family protein [Vicinamibacteria bacterium]